MPTGAGCVGVGDLQDVMCDNRAPNMRESAIFQGGRNVCA